jgi:dihydrofolate reductase
MGKLIQWNVMSLDGYFEGATSWALDWHQSVLSEEFHNYCAEQLAVTSLLLFGRVTYQGMAAYWKTAEGRIADYMNNLPKAVASRTLKSVEWSNTKLLDGDAVDAVKKLKAEAKGSLLVMGSGKFSEALTRAELFDEFRISLAPVVLGAGTTLFGRNLPHTALHHEETKTLANGCVILRYTPQRKI